MGRPNSPQLSPQWLLRFLLIVVFLFLTGCIDPCRIQGADCAPAIHQQGSINLLPSPTATSEVAAAPVAQSNSEGMSAERGEALPWIAPSPLHPTIVEEVLTVAAGEQQRITVTVAGSVVLFYLFSDTPITVTLVDPTGWVIDPAIADAEPAIIYGSGQGNPLTTHGWSTQYQVLTPVPGDWQVRIAATEPNSVLLYGAVKADHQLQIRPDKVSYGYGELVTVQASLEENKQPLVGATISGTVVWGDGTTLPLSFGDDGQQGDATAQDGIYTAHFQAPMINSRPAIRLRASHEHIVQLDQTTIDVIGPTATLQRVSAERVVDTNNNGLIDRLELDLLLDVQTAGSYSIQGRLYDSSGQELVMGSYDTPRGGTLAADDQTITLTFDGETLRDLGRDGPYTFSNFAILYKDANFYSPFTVDMRQNVYTITAYSHRQFQGYLIKLLSSSEEVTDPDHDGLHNQLIVKVQLDLLAPGPYTWTGQLVDQFNRNIGWTAGAGHLDSQTPMTFVFDGAAIHQKGWSGPYKLRNVAVHRTDGNPLNMHWGNVHTSAAYSVNQFEEAVR